jgi:hypothetical protein
VIKEKFYGQSSKTTGSVDVARAIEHYRLANSNVNDNNNHDIEKGINGINPRISVKIDIVFEG